MGQGVGDTTAVADDVQAVMTGFQLLVYFHFPPVFKDFVCREIVDALKDYGITQCYYGHIHGEEGFRTAVQGGYYGTEYRLISADYLNCSLLKIR